MRMVTTLNAIFTGQKQALVHPSMQSTSAFSAPPREKTVHKIVRDSGISGLNILYSEVSTTRLRRAAGLCMLATQYVANGKMIMVGEKMVVI